MSYQYGEEIEYKLIKPEDKEKLQAFLCGNEQLDYYIHNELISGDSVYNEDGLSFKVVDINTNDILAVFSLATSGIIWKVDSFTKLLPAIKVDILAVDLKYQKVHMDKESMKSDEPDEHFYFSDSVMCSIIKHCRNINDNYQTLSLL